MDYLVPFALGEKPWPHEQLNGLPADRILPLLRRAARALPEPSYGAGRRRRWATEG